MLTFDQENIYRFLVVKAKQFGAKTSHKDLVTSSKLSIVTLAKLWFSFVVATN